VNIAKKWRETLVLFHHDPDSTDRMVMFVAASARGI